MTDEKKTETAKEAATVKKAMISQPMAGKTDEEIVATRDLAVAKLRERRNRQWWESRARCGYATVCPLCGGYTLSKTGYHAGCAKKAGIKIPRQRMKRALLTAKERQKIPVARMAGPVGAVVRDDGVRFESAGAAALATYGYCGSSNIVRAVRTGCKAGGHYWKRADEEDK